MLLNIYNFLFEKANTFYEPFKMEKNISSGIEHCENMNIKGGKIVQCKEKYCKSIKQYNLSKIIEMNVTSRRIKQIYKQ